MAKKTPQLDTPFRTGEKVMTTRPVPEAKAGTHGKVRLVNGIGPWMRYWVRFSDGSIGRQIDHDDLVRPAQKEEWEVRKLELAKAARDKSAADAKPKPAKDKSDSAASRIPASLLNRSKNAKKKSS